MEWFLRGFFGEFSDEICGGVAVAPVELQPPAMSSVDSLAANWSRRLGAPLPRPKCFRVFFVDADATVYGSSGARRTSALCAGGHQHQREGHLDVTGASEAHGAGSDVVSK